MTTILDDHVQMQALDPDNMMAYLQALPTDLLKAWRIGGEQNLPPLGNIRQVIISGMGGSAIGADMAATYAAYTGLVPVHVHRDYGLPSWVQGQETMVIASSHSGNTEETLSSYMEARMRGCRCMAVCTGGKLAAMAGNDGIPVWLFQHTGQPRAAVPFSFGLLLAALTRLQILPDPQKELMEAAECMEAQARQLDPVVPVSANPAKRQAGQWMNRWVTVMASDYLAPIARRWKGQVNELAKAWAQFETLPEADHNSLAGIFMPESVLTQTVVMFLQSPSDHPRNRLRSELTRQMILEAGIGTDVYHARGKSPLAHMWTSLQFGDYSAYYLAMLYGMDPTPIPTLVALKNALSGQ